MWFQRVSSSLTNIYSQPGGRETRGGGGGGDRERRRRDGEGGGRKRRRERDREGGREGREREERREKEKGREGGGGERERRREEETDRQTDRDRLTERQRDRERERESNRKELTRTDYPFPLNCTTTQPSTRLFTTSAVLGYTWRLIWGMTCHTHTPAPPRCKHTANPGVKNHTQRKLKMSTDRNPCLNESFLSSPYLFQPATHTKSPNLSC